MLDEALSLESTTRGCHRQIRVYGLSYNNAVRKARVTGRFASIGLDVHWVEPVPPTHECLGAVEDAHTRRVHSCMYGHLSMLRAFLDSARDDVDAPAYGVFCEDDICIRRDFNACVRIAVDAYARLGADVMLLGYLMPLKAVTEVCAHAVFTPVEPVFSFFTVYKELWGSQMYMYSRPAAARALEAFGDPLLMPEATPFSADWTLTKFGKALAMYPMLAVEEGEIGTDSVEQNAYHAQCFRVNFDKDIHI